MALIILQIQNYYQAEKDIGQNSNALALPIHFSISNIN